MNKKRVTSPVSFADSGYKSFYMTEDATLTICMKSWQEEPFKIVFKHAIQFMYKLGDVPNGLYELDHTLFLNEALQLEYIKVPSNHPYKHFQLEDISDFPFIQVIADSVTVLKV
jgi:hypothetical protein